MQLKGAQGLAKDEKGRAITSPGVGVERHGKCRVIAYVFNLIELDRQSDITPVEWIRMLAALNLR